MEVLLILILAAVVAAVFFNKTLSVNITIKHVLEQPQVPGSNTTLTQTDRDFEKMEEDAFHQVTKAMHLFQEVETHENSSRT